MEERYVITSYKNPDLDGVASMYAYKEFIEKCGKRADYYIYGTPKKEVKIVCDMFGINLKGTNEIKDTDNIVLVDTNSIKFLSDKILPENVTEIIDHHLHSKDLPLFVNANVTIKLFGAAATIVAERFKEYDIEISEKSAALLYYGIISNTINLKSHITCTEDRIMSEELKKKYSTITDEKILKLFKECANIHDSLDREMEANKGAKIFEDKTIMIGQLEMTDTDSFLLESKLKIEEIMKENSKRENVDFAFCNVIDAVNGKSTFVTIDEKTKNLLEEHFDASFLDNLSANNDLITRKEIVRKLRI